MTHIFVHDLFQGFLKDRPWENLDVLLDVPRARLRESHNETEESLVATLILGDRRRLESLEISADAVLLFDGETVANDCLEQIDDVDRGNVELFRIGATDAADHDTGFDVIILIDGGKAKVDVGTILCAPKLNQAATRGYLF